MNSSSYNTIVLLQVIGAIHKNKEHYSPLYSKDVLNLEKMQSFLYKLLDKSKDITCFIKDFEFPVNKENINSSLEKLVSKKIIKTDKNNNIKITKKGIATINEMQIPENDKKYFETYLKTARGKKTGEDAQEHEELMYHLIVGDVIDLITSYPVDKACQGNKEKTALDYDSNSLSIKLTTRGLLYAEKTFIIISDVRRFVNSFGIGITIDEILSQF